jgi:hypothetical protein
MSMLIFFLFLPVVYSVYEYTLVSVGGNTLCIAYEHVYEQHTLHCV